jgi:hypothetical protein
VVARRSALTLLVTGAAAAGACDRADGAGPAPNAGSTDPAVAQVVFGVRHNVTVGGVRRAELQADTALFGDSTTSVELRGVRLVLYSPAGDSVGAVTAPAATYDLRARRLAARGGVTLLVAGRRTTAPGAVFDGETGRVTESGARPAEARRGAGEARR